MTTTTRGDEMLALRKARMAAAPPILRGGFRPFFLFGGAWAAIALVLWLCALLAGLHLPSGFQALAWHRHEMLFGFVGAIISGFLLTAIPNWTGRLPIAGAPLAALFGLWLAARVAVFFSATLGLVPAAVLDAGFYGVMAAVCGREVFAAKNRNKPVVAMVLLLGLADAADYAAAAGFVSDAEAGIRAGIGLIVLIISVIGGRVVPSFTRNWLAKQGYKSGLPGQPGRFDQAAITVTAVALLGWVVIPTAAAVGWALILAGLLQFARLTRWSGWRTWAEPFVAILHVGYLWLPVGLVMLGCSVVGGAVPRTAAIHALTAGLMGTMILAMMPRATLGHTGHELKANAATNFIYVCVTLGAVLRVATSFGMFGYARGLELAGGFWALSFAIFVAAYGPIIFRSRRGDPTR